MRNTPETVSKEISKEELDIVDNLVNDFKKEIKDQNLDEDLYLELLFLVLSDKKFSQIINNQ